MKLGRIPSRVDRRTLALVDYLDRDALPAPPPARDWTHPTRTWGMYRNDAIGDCTCAALAHLLLSVAAAAGRQLAITADDVIALYSHVSGYDPSDPTTDRGAQMIDALRALRTVGIADHQIGAFATFDPHHLEHAINQFGGAYVGLDLPITAQHQGVWELPAEHRQTDEDDAGSWGAHAAAVLGYDQLHVRLISWGRVQLATRAWLRAYTSEAWVVIDPLWLYEGLSPSGFDAAELRADLYDLQGAPRE